MATAQPDIAATKPSVDDEHDLRRCEIVSVVARVWTVGEVERILSCHQAMSLVVSEMPAETHNVYGNRK